MKTLILDIGGTNIKTGFFLDKTLVDFKNYKTFDNANKGLEEFKKTLHKIIEDYKKNFLEINKIKIGMPGPFINKEEGIIGNTNNLPLNNFNLKKFIKNIYNNVDIVIENDANCFALSHLYENKKYKNIVGITLGTGFGVGIIINKKLYVGRGNAGEISNIPYKESIIDDYVSAKGLKKIVKETNIKINEVSELSDEKYLKVWEEFSKDLAFALSVIIYSFDPEIIYFGGGISKSFHLFESYVNRELKKILKIEMPIIKKSHLNNNIHGINLL